MNDARSQGYVQLSVSKGYERFMLRQLFEPWAAELLSRADLQPGWSVLDASASLLTGYSILASSGAVPATSTRP